MCNSALFVCSNVEEFIHFVHTFAALPQLEGHPCLQATACPTHP